MRGGLLVGGAALALTLAAVLLTRPPAKDPVPVVRLGLELPPGLVLEQDYAAPFALAPDGARLLVLARKDGSLRLHLRELGNTEVLSVAGTENAWLPFFSPDGSEIAFFADRKLKKVPLEGGPALTLAEIGDNPRGGSWGEDGSIVLAPSLNEGLSLVSAKGGEVTSLTRLDLPSGESSHRWPQVLPGGEWVIFTTGFEATSYDDAALDAVSLTTRARRRLVEGGSFGRYASGRLSSRRAAGCWRCLWISQPSPSAGPPRRCSRACATIRGTGAPTSRSPPRGPSSTVEGFRASSSTTSPGWTKAGGSRASAALRDAFASHRSAPTVDEWRW